MNNLNLLSSPNTRMNQAAMNPGQIAQNDRKVTHMQEQSMKCEFKIVVTGNVGSGKSTSIRAISEVPVIGGEAKATESDALHRKATTTVSMDYGIAHIQNTKLHLYGTPGQRRFDFMSHILCKGAHGMVVMIDNGCADPLREIDYYLNQHRDFLLKNPGLIAITHFDDNNTDTSLIDYHTYIIQHGFTCPVMLLDARNRHEFHKVLSRLLLQISDTKVGKKRCPEAGLLPYSVSTLTFNLETVMNELLSELLKIDNFIKSSAIASYDGVSHGYSEAHGMDEDYISAMSAAIFAASKKGITQLIGGKIKQIIIEGDEGHVLITSPSDELLLTTVAHAGANVQAILQQMSLVKERISADGLVLAPQVVLESP